MDGSGRAGVEEEERKAAAKCGEGRAEVYINCWLPFPSSFFLFEPGFPRFDKAFPFLKYLAGPLFPYSFFSISTDLWRQFPCFLCCRLRGHKYHDTDGQICHFLTIHQLAQTSVTLLELPAL